MKIRPDIARSLAAATLTASLWLQGCAAPTAVLVIGQPDLVSYDYAKHFGGVLYLFVRGMCAGAPASAGVYFDCPPASSIAGLRSALAGEQGGRP